MVVAMLKMDQARLMIEKACKVPGEKKAYQPVPEVRIGDDITFSYFPNSEMDVEVVAIITGKVGKYTYELNIWQVMYNGELYPGDMSIGSPPKYICWKRTRDGLSFRVICEDKNYVLTSRYMLSRH